MKRPATEITVVEEKQEKISNEVDTELLKKHLFYPANYDTFNVDNIIFSVKPMKPKKFDGLMWFPRYKFEDGIYDLTIQSPVMRTPTGVTDWETSFSMLVSLNRDWETDSFQLKYYEIMQAIQTKIASFLTETKGAGRITDKDEVSKLIKPIMTIRNDFETGQAYPPSKKITVITNAMSPGAIKSSFFAKDTHDAHPIPILHSDVKPISDVAFTEVFKWVYRKKNSNGTLEFSCRFNLVQCCVLPRVAGDFPVVEEVPVPNCSLVL